VLEKAGWSVWYDPELPAHRAYADVIATELDAAPAVLVLWSEAAAASEWVRSEANRGRELHKLVQARLDDARLPMPFDQIQCADLRNSRAANSDPGWSQVRKSIEALVAGPTGNTDYRSPDHDSRRRNLLIGGAAVAAAAAVGFGYWRTQPSGEALSPQAQLLMQKGFDALQDNDALDPSGPGSTMQAIALLTQATEAAQGSAPAWGALALAYAVRKRTVPRPERPGLEMRSRAAARTALRIDPHEGRALGALLLLQPVYRHWLASERADRATVQRNASIPLLLSITSDMLGHVGRWTDALGFSKRMDRQHFLIPGADRRFITDLWGSGDLQAADSAVQAAIERWPQQPEIWRMRAAYLMYSGRPAETLSLLRDGAELPNEISSDFVNAMRLTAEALAGTRPSHSAVEEALGYLHANAGEALRVATACTALGALENALRSSRDITSHPVPGRS
jgi:hypothetical protein